MLYLGVFDSRWRYVVCVIDGLAPPIDKWQKAVNEQLEKIRKLEEIYEHELILRKVGTVCGAVNGRLLLALAVRFNCIH